MRAEGANVCASFAIDKERHLPDNPQAIRDKANAALQHDTDCRCECSAIIGVNAVGVRGNNRYSRARLRRRAQTNRGKPERKTRHVERDRGVDDERVGGASGEEE
jgi:hypothetical protein